MKEFTKNEILSIFLKDDGYVNKHRVTKTYLNKNPELKEYLENIYPDSPTIMEKLYRIKYDIFEHPVCKCGCGQLVKFKRFTTGYHLYASCKCAQNSKEVKEHIKVSNLEKYGVEYAFQNKDIQEKQKQTCLEKYGVEHPLQNKDIQEKIKNTIKRKYGVEHVLQYKNFLEHYKETCLKKYGVDNAFKVKEFQEKQKETCLEKYGVENVFQNKDIQEKQKQTCLEKYGVENVSKLPEVVKKIHESKKKNHSYGKSKQEDLVYDLLKEKFNIVIRQYSSDLYPFNCDFYIQDIDLYIECNFHWSHGFHIFDKNNIDDIQKLKYWKQKAETSKFYENAINNWTIRDVLKYETFIKNKLKYKIFFKLDEVYDFLKNYKK